MAIKGEWVTGHINSWGNAICEIQAASVACLDKVGYCQTAMARDANFCYSPYTLQFATHACLRSCGFCYDGPFVMCNEPSSTTYNRASPYDTVHVGEPMTFECQSGYLHESGDLERACGPDGDLLGTEPVCVATPITTRDIRMEALQRLSSSLFYRYGFVLDYDGYRVPFNGKITRYFYYCNGYGWVFLAVLRPQPTKYYYIYGHWIYCNPSWIQQYNVPTSSQISVQTGDVLGVWAQDSNTISAVSCGSEVYKVMNIPAIYAPNLNDFVYAASYSSYQTICMAPALAYTVEKT